MKRTWLVAWITIVLGCGGAAKPEPGAPAPAPSEPAADAKSGFRFLPIPDALRSDLARATLLGGAIEMMDRAAWQATDAVLARGTPDPHVAGWTTRLHDDEVQVHFVGGPVDKPLVYYLVHMGKTDADPPRVEVMDPPVAADDEVATMFRARELVRGQVAALVAKAHGELCPGTYNTVVLPARLDDQPGWLVYLLAATTDPDLRILAGHHRVHVSADATTVLDVQPLSLTCVTTSVPSDDHSAGLYVEHKLGDLPLESHVFTSLTYGKPLLVKTAGHVWLVDGDQIQLVDK